MPRADYTCPGCPGLIVRDHYFASAVGAIQGAPVCPVCEIFMEWIPAARFDVKSDGEGGKGFQKFEVCREIQTRQGVVQQVETIDSLHKIRAIERDSEQRYIDHEGEPMRFRGYTQNASNMDQNSFGAAGAIGPEGQRRSYDSGSAPAGSEKINITRHGQKKPRIPMGPGMTGRNASPLK